jgi:6-phosphogluconolactonase/glucosamine-6-phosphate isomerase/deaminase
MQFLIPENVRVYILSSKGEVITKISKNLNIVLANTIKVEAPVLLLVSGGSAFDIFPHIDINNFGDKVTLGVLDERFSINSSENNMTQLKATDFYKQVLSNGCHIIDTAVIDGETIEQLENRFNDALLGWIKNNPQGVVIATVGIGPDGHTSGILPFPENPSLFSQLFENSKKLVVNYDADGKNPYRYRVTTTNTFLRDYIDHAFVYAVGENKKDALIRLKSDSGDLATTPARILREMKNVDLFTDIDIK